MTEAEWLASWKYWLLYDAVRGRESVRKLRLYMAACCRLMSDHFFDPRMEPGILAVEQCADDPKVEALARRVDWNLVTGGEQRIYRIRWRRDLTMRILDVNRLLDELWGGSESKTRIDWRRRLANAVAISLRDKPEKVYTGGTGNAAEYCTLLVNASYRMQDSEEFGFEDLYSWNTDLLESQDSEFPTQIAGLLRDIFGNPFRPVSFSPEWRTSTVVSLAKTMYESRDFAPMPLLADALQDAGCEHEDILAHCRVTNGVHVRGCWVVDLVLGKS